MADILTTLRELSVAYYFIEGDNVPSPQEFLNTCKNNISGCEYLNNDSISYSYDSFNTGENSAIHNGFKLGQILKEKLHISENPYIKWTGSETQSGSPVDLIIDSKKLSLKEHSNIIGNIGLYQMLNILTNTNNYKRGVHIFRDFAPREFNEWFETTRDIFINNYNDPILINNNRYSSGLIYQNDILSLQYSKNGQPDTINITNFSSCDHARYNNETNSLFREKVFSKWINNYISSNSHYLNAKAKCAEAAGRNLLNLIYQYKGTSPLLLTQLFRIEEDEYYYAKTTNNYVEIYKVPSIYNFSQNVLITDIQVSVPSSQLNLITVIENMQTAQKIEFRNELRYSHGQLNGTPEAKFYKSTGELSTIYQKII